MDISRFFAHSTNRHDKSDWQSLRDHLIKVGEIAAYNASFFGAENLASLAGLLHDLGKYTDEFQLRLEGKFPRMDHATWGARIARERYGFLGHMLAYCIAGHHAGLANGKDGSTRRALSDRLDGSAEHLLLPDWENELPLPKADALAMPSGFKVRKERQQFQMAFLGRMLFSCLVDGDFIDTDEFYRKTEGQPPRRTEKHISLQKLRERLNLHLASFSADSEVNQIRSEILTHVRSQAESQTGLFSLTVPTGGGKTLASLAFALDHAIHNGLRRVIFVIPFTSIVEQNAAVFRKALGDLGDKAVLEHHSAFIDDPTKARESKEKLRLAMENWDAPIIVTTAVQFFESLFADRPSRCRKLHNITGSVVIFDEAQTLPLRLLRPCLAAMDELALNYRTSVVLCTATQPALRAEDGFRDGLQNVRELAPAPQHLYQRLKRVRVQHVGILSDDDLIEHLRSRAQVLCIVNNRRHARTLYQSIADQPGARHLTTLMCAKHRSHVLAEVRVLLKSGEPCRLVSTSLIEAGVDVDFPTVLRAETGLDSIAQAAGRCNREGRRPPHESDVLVFSTANEDWAPPPELKQLAQAFREIERKHRDDPLSLEAIRNYFQLVYWQRGDLELDTANLLGLLRGSRLESLPYETLANQFRMIDSVMMPVIVPFDDYAIKAIRELEFAEGCVGIARRLQPYLVQVPRQGYEALSRARAILPVKPERYGDQFMQLLNVDLYDQRFGLHWEDPEFLSANRLVF